MSDEPTKPTAPSSDEDIRRAIASFNAAVRRASKKGRIPRVVYGPQPKAP